MTTTPSLVSTPTWNPATWDDYIQLLDHPQYKSAKGYFFQNHLRLEMLPVGFDHSKDHTIITVAISLYTILHEIPINTLDTCSFRQSGLQECQPDIACYIGNNAKNIPQGTNIVDLNRFSSPDLAIEISKTTLLDDLGVKRSLYEAMNVSEYWVVDVTQARIFAYAIRDRGSHQIDESTVIAGLSFSILNQALQRSRTADQSTVGAWLMAQFHQS